MLWLLHPDQFSDFSALLLGWLLAAVSGCSRGVFLLVSQVLVSKQAGARQGQQETLGGGCWK